MMEQVFISYKSQNANIVRRIVDNLIANGFNVWFAEYEVNASNYEEFSRLIDSQITEAIGNSTHAILFTNNLWGNSRYCQHEKTQILQGNFPIKAIQVCLPKETQPLLPLQESSNIPCIEHKEDSLRETLKFIIEELVGSSKGLDQNFYSIEDTPNVFVFRYGRLNIGRLNYTGCSAGLGRVGKEHEYRFEGELDGIGVRLEIDIDPYNTAVKRRTLEAAQMKIVDDREVYKLMRIRANRWYKKNPLNEHGLHLFFQEGTSNIGFTYWTAQPNNSHKWFRVYSVISQDERYGIPITVTYYFSALFTTTDRAKSFRKFCSLLNYGEQIIHSYEYESDPCLQYIPSKMFNRLVKIMGYILVAAVVLILIYSQQPGASQWPWTAFYIPIGLFVGWMLGQMLEFCIMYKYLMCLEQTKRAGLEC